MVDETADAAPAADAAEGEQAAGAPVDLAELGRRYAVVAGLTETLRDAFRELKRRPAEAKRLAALLRGLARKHESEAQSAAEQITRLVERIQAPPPAQS